ncbi:F-box protein CPR1-like [Impatiens glandulifera]|uniref:F-box protein CPR1-like n=1 Tax=Impatiens glandulifera TaxID=253017 RepID=UPI001FB172B0|nr:F-box protein CPR1-like [Impatiens glandulifera]
MEQLPNEILEKIICLLPVKCVLRLRCVSKSWLAIISSPYFVKLHLKRSVQTKSNLRLFRWRYDLFQVDFNSLYEGNDLQMVKVDSIPLMFRKYGLVPNCSCDGLLCMSTICVIQNVLLCNPSPRRYYGPNCSVDGLYCMPKVRAIENVFLWNPSTRKSIKLPYASIEIANQSDRLNAYVYCCYRIGYDNNNDDYKVVRIVILISYHLDIIIDYEIKVYSLRSNFWHRPEKFSHCPNWISFGNIIVGRALHWISTVKSDLKRESLIVAFDFGTEKYRVLPQPEYSSPHFDLYLDNFGGCLSLSCKYESSIVDVFLLKEYGKKNEHWSRLITLSPTTTSEIYHPVTPIAYSKCGKKVWLHMGRMRLVLYNLEQKLVEENTVDGKRELTSPLHTCFESLVSIDVPVAPMVTWEVV